jgi:hypothetical protein
LKLRNCQVFFLAELESSFSHHSCIRRRVYFVEADQFMLDSLYHSTIYLWLFHVFEFSSHDTLKFHQIRVFDAIPTVIHYGKTEEDNLNGFPD